MKLPRQTRRRALLRPEPLIALLVFVASTAFWLNGKGDRRETPPLIEVSQPEPTTLETREVRLVRYDAGGLEAPLFASVALPDDLPGRLEAILEALRLEMAGQEWPEELPTPTVYVESVARRSVAILDFRPSAPVSLSVVDELKLQRSVQETLLANGVDQIRYLLNGEATGVFLEHLAVPATL